MLIRLLIILLLLSPSVYAQEDGDGFFEDDGYDEPYEEPEPEPSPELPSPVAPGGANFAPSPRDRFRSPPRRVNTPPSNSGGNSGSSSRVSQGGDDEIEFILVDPPKYWKPKKRKQRPLAK